MFKINKLKNVTT